MIFGTLVRYLFILSLPIYIKGISGYSSSPSALAHCSLAPFTAVYSRSEINKRKLVFFVFLSLTRTFAQT